MDKHTEERFLILLKQLVSEVSGIREELEAMNARKSKGYCFNLTCGEVQDGSEGGFPTQLCSEDEME